MPIYIGANISRERIPGPLLQRPHDAERRAAIAGDAAHRNGFRLPVNLALLLEGQLIRNACHCTTWHCDGVRNRGFFTLVGGSDAPRLEWLPAAAMDTANGDLFGPFFGDRSSAKKWLMYAAREHRLCDHQLVFPAHVRWASPASRGRWDALSRCLRRRRERHPLFGTATRWQLEPMRFPVALRG